MAVSKNNPSSRQGVENNNVYVKHVKKAGAYVKTWFEKGIQKQAWYSDAECTQSVTK